MAEHPFEDNDPSVYSSHVLYVKNDPNCVAVTSRLETLPLGQEVFTQDVMNMSQRPSWLQGVPSLYVRNGGKVITGARDILAYASTWRNMEPSSMTSSIYSTSSVSGSSLGCGSLFDSAMLFSIEGDPTPTSVSTHPAQGGGPQMGERARRKAEMAAVTNNAVEQMQNARASMDRNIHASMQRGNLPPPRDMMAQEQDVQVPMMRRREGW